MLSRNLATCPPPHSVSPAGGQSSACPFGIFDLGQPVLFTDGEPGELRPGQPGEVLLGLPGEQSEVGQGGHHGLEFVLVPPLPVQVEDGLETRVVVAGLQQGGGDQPGLSAHQAGQDGPEELPDHPGDEAVLVVQPWPPADTYSLLPCPSVGQVLLRHLLGESRTWDSPSAWSRSSGGCCTGRSWSGRGTCRTCHVMWV